MVGGGLLTSDYKISCVGGGGGSKYLIFWLCNMWIPTWVTYWTRFWNTDSYFNKLFSYIVAHMNLQTIVRFIIVCFLAIEARVVRTDDPTVSLASDDADIFSPADRRRWFKKVFRWVKRCIRTIDYRRLARCKFNCVRRYRHNRRYLVYCAGRCLAASRVHRCFWRKIFG